MGISMVTTKPRASVHACALTIVAGVLASMCETLDAYVCCLMRFLGWCVRAGGRAKFSCTPTCRYANYVASITKFMKVLPKYKADREMAGEYSGLVDCLTAIMSAAEDAKKQASQTYVAGARSGALVTPTTALIVVFLLEGCSQVRAHSGFRSRTRTWLRLCVRVVRMCMDADRA